MIIVNDLHLGLKRKTGVTEASLKVYKEFQYAIFQKILEDNPGEDLVILGDIFDGGNIGYGDLWRTNELLRSHSGRVALVAGNHDLNKNAEQLSAFDFLAKLRTDPTVTVIRNWDISPDFAVVPHLQNQAIFDAAIAEVAEAGAKVLLCHANCNNGFAVTKDHSLNLTPEQAGQFDLVIMGHEHNRRSVGNVVVLGAQYPTSISDCAVSKGYHRWAGPGHLPEFVETWSTDDYVDIPWQDLGGEFVPRTYHFVRVIGNATAEEAAEVIDRVNHFRQGSDAFFITNSVQVGEINLGDIEEVTEEQLGAFDPLNALLELLPEEHSNRLREEMERCS